MKTLKCYLIILFFLCTITLNVSESVAKEYVFSFTSSVVYGSQKNDLSIYVSTDFKGGNSIEEIKQSEWKDITKEVKLSEGSPFVSSGDLNFKNYIELGEPLFIAFKYSAPATPKMTQRMWRINGATFLHNSSPIPLSNWLFINHEDNEDNVGWEETPKGIQYRSRMTKKKSESWAIIQVSLAGAKMVIAGNASEGSPQSVSVVKPNDKGTTRNIDVITRDDLKEAMYKAYLHHGPSIEDISTVDPKMEVLQKTKETDHERWHVKYKVDRDEYSYAFLLLPLNVSNGGKFPLMLCPHPTYLQGKNRVVALYDAPAKDRNDSLKRVSGQYGLDLVRQGFVVFAPDRAGYGERSPLPGKSFKENMTAYSKTMKESYPKFGLNGKAIWDLQRALDMLLNYDFVDGKNIGIIGHSLGAWDAILLSALDERVKATVVNSGGMVSYLPELWSEDQTALKSYLESPAKQFLTSNVNISLMLNAERSVFYIFSLRDPFYKGEPQLVDGYKTIYEYYKKNNPKKRADISYLLHTDGHTFYPTAKLAAYSWLEERLLTKK